MRVPDRQHLDKGPPNHWSQIRPLSKLLSNSGVNSYVDRPSCNHGGSASRADAQQVFDAKQITGLDISQQLIIFRYLFSMPRDDVHDDIINIPPPDDFCTVCKPNLCQRMESRVVEYTPRTSHD